MSVKLCGRCEYEGLPRCGGAHLDMCLKNGWAEIAEDTKPGGTVGNGERDNAIKAFKERMANYEQGVDLCECGPMTRAEGICECSDNHSAAQSELEANAKAWHRARERSRVFATGASRDTEHGKLDYDGFLSPLVLERYAIYMDKHRIQSDGELRASDNWQKGIPDDAYMKSLWRHFMEVWKAHRSGDGKSVGMEDALCGVLFNTMGLLYEIVRIEAT